MSGDATRPEVDPAIFAPTHPEQPKATGAGAQCVPEPRIAPVDQALNEAQAMADMLNPQLDALISMLEPILSPEPPAEPEKRLAQHGTSPFSDRLYVLIGDLERLRKKVLDTSARVEI